MTSEEAKAYFVERVQFLIEGADRFPPIPIMAFEMAIEALQAQPTHGRLIDADALIAKINKTVSDIARAEQDNYGISLHSGNIMATYSDLIRLVMDAPTVQADRPHGEWIADTENMTLNCSLCGEQFKFDDVDEMLDYKEYAHFCIHCGSDMRERRET